jgi:hypothetical protein
MIMGIIAIRARVILSGVVLKITCEIYSLPINATPDIEAALEIRIMQLMANAMDG